MSNRTVQAAAEGMPAVHVAAEDPHDRARRLMKELSETLNDCFGGQWGAEVYPSRLASVVGPTGFFNLRTHLAAWHRGRRAQGYLDRIRRMAPGEQAALYQKRLNRARALDAP